MTTAADKFAGLHAALVKKVTVVYRHPRSAHAVLSRFSARSRAQTPLLRDG